MSEININEVIASPGAERAVIANCINNANNIIECETMGLYPKHFAIEANKIIYNAIMFLFTKNASVDPLSIVNIIKDEKAKQEIEKLGGLEYLILLQQAPISSNIRMFVQEILTHYAKRQIYVTGEEMQQLALNNKSDDTDTLLGMVNQKTTDLTLDNSKVTEAYKMGSKMEERLKRYAEQPNVVRGLPTGWRKFDTITGGGEAGDLVVIAAESKTGKSVTLMNWAKNIAVDCGLPILYIDVEMSEEEQEDRLLSVVSQLPEKEEIKSGMFAEDTAFGTAKDKVARLKYASKMIGDSQFYHIYMSDFTLEKIAAITRKFYLKHGIAALFFDYINFNPTLMAQNRHLRDDLILTNLATGLKNLAGDLKIPVFTAIQENRSGYGNTEKDARNIGGSIGVLQKATKLLFLRNKTEEELALEGASKGNQKMIIKYARHGAGDQEINVLYDRIRVSQMEV